MGYVPSTHACSCIENPDPVASLERAAAVFSGRVLEIEGSFNDFGFATRTVRFDVDRAWKGVETAKLKVGTAGDSAACGFDFVEGERYLVYTYGENGDLQASLCSRTANLNDVSESELAALGEPNFYPEYEDAPPVVFLAMFLRWIFNPFALMVAFAIIVITYFLKKSQSKKKA